jgi:hypothetical protein
MMRGYFAGLGTKNALTGKCDDNTLKAGQTPMGLGIASAGNARQFTTFDRKLARQARRTTRLETISL